MNHVTKHVKVGTAEVGAGNFSVFAGPCSVESLTQFSETAHVVKRMGGAGLRGGIFKLRTDPNSFQGLGAEAYDLVKTVKRETGLPFVSEVTDPRQISDLENVVDMFQVGSRNMHNYALLKELGQTTRPVMIKRGFSALVKEWILAADYVVKAGNENVILCERGIRTFENAYRNTFDVNAIVAAKRSCSFPILADPSHGTGDANMVSPVALAAAVAGADGMLVEVHPRPSEALSDGYQSLNFDQFERLMDQLEKVLGALGRKIAHA